MCRFSRVLIFSFLGIYSAFTVAQPPSVAAEMDISEEAPGVGSGGPPLVKKGWATEDADVADFLPGISRPFVEGRQHLPRYKDTLGFVVRISKKLPVSESSFISLADFKPQLQALSGAFNGFSEVLRASSTSMLSRDYGVAYILMREAEVFRGHSRNCLRFIVFASSKSKEGAQFQDIMEMLLSAESFAELPWDEQVLTAGFSPFHRAIAMEKAVPSAFPVDMETTLKSLSAEELLMGADALPLVTPPSEHEIGFVWKKDFLEQKAIPTLRALQDALEEDAIFNESCSRIKALWDEPQERGLSEMDRVLYSYIKSMKERPLEIEFDLSVPFAEFEIPQKRILLNRLVKDSRKENPRLFYNVLQQEALRHTFLPFYEHFKGLVNLHYLGFKFLEGEGDDRLTLYGLDGETYLKKLSHLYTLTIFLTNTLR